MGESEQNKSIVDHLKLHKDAIFYYLYKKTNDRDLAQDLAQDVYLRIHKSAHTFDSQKGDFGAWSNRIAHNVFLTHLKKTGRMPPESTLDSADEEYIPSTQVTTAEVVEKNILLQEIKKAIQCLPEPEKTVFINKEIHNKKLGDTATQLDMSIRTISRKLVSAYELLKIELEKQGISAEGFIAG